MQQNTAIEIMTKTASDFTDAEALVYIANYSGSDFFMPKLQAALLRYRSLSSKQLQCVKNDQAKMHNKNVPKDAAPQIKAEIESASLPKDSTIVVSRFYAKKFGSEVGLNTKGHFTFNVLKVLAENDSSYMLEIQATGKRTSFCACCAAKLSDPYSVTHGIGPVCAKKYGITNTEQLDVLTAKTKPIQVWLKKWGVKHIISAEVMQ